MAAGSSDAAMDLPTTKKVAKECGNAASAKVLEQMHADRKTAEERLRPRPRFAL